MKKRILCALLALMLLGSCASAQALPEMVRLHVVAEDDSPQAQALKLVLRDECLRCARVCLSDAADADEAWRRLEIHLPDFEAACTARARELGFDGEIRAEAGVFEFPDRIYGSVKLPAGEYRALRVTIGAGEGHNWWCVLYPSLCALDEADAASSDAPCYSRVWNWLRSGFGSLK